jgi:hypothetical protein
MSGPGRRGLPAFRVIIPRFGNVGAEHRRGVAESVKVGRRRVVKTRETERSRKTERERMEQERDQALAGPSPQVVQRRRGTSRAVTCKVKAGEGEEW